LGEIVLAIIEIREDAVACVVQRLKHLDVVVHRAYFPPGFFRQTLLEESAYELKGCRGVVWVWSWPPRYGCSPCKAACRRFPARNRIIAGLAAATVVVEARERSGALITADFALEAGREVFAVPGEITSSLSAGTNALLRLGATPLTRAGDVLEALGIESAAASALELGESARAVLEAVTLEPAGADRLVRGTGLDAAAVATALAELELAGAVAEAEGLYRRVTP
jgi:hypothetical protein